MARHWKITIALLGMSVLAGLTENYFIGLTSGLTSSTGQSSRA